MNFKGGYKIIDLRSLTLTPSEDGTTLIDIEDPKVLLQLDSLKEYLDVSKDLKPIYLRVTDNDTVMCELKRDIEHSTFYIHAILMGYVLMISAAFTQDEETLFWYVDEAKYLYVSDEVRLNKELSSIESGDIVNVVGIDENNNVVKQPKNDVILFEDIKDKYGNKRFIEGEGDLSTISGITFTYNKWSLSGTHLMFVLAGEIENGKQLTFGSVLVEYRLPEWLVNKLVTIASSAIDVKTTNLYASNLSTQTVTTLLRKLSDHVDISTGDITLSADRSFRISFDLLIDDE